MSLFITVFSPTHHRMTFSRNKQQQMAMQDGGHYASDESLARLSSQQIRIQPSAIEHDVAKPATATIPHTHELFPVTRYPVRQTATNEIAEAVATISNTHSEMHVAYFLISCTFCVRVFVVDNRGCSDPGSFFKTLNYPGQ